MEKLQALALIDEESDQPPFLQREEKDERESPLVTEPDNSLVSLGGAVVEKCKVIDLDVELATKGSLNTAGRLRLVERAQQGDHKAMSAICHYAYPLAEKIVKNIARMMSSDDKIQVGLARVPEAVKKFDPSRGIGFEVYLAQRIKWAVLEEQRRQSIQKGRPKADHRKINDVLFEAQEAGESPNRRLHQLTQGKHGMLLPHDIISQEGLVQSSQVSIEAMAGGENAISQDPAQDVTTGLEALLQEEEERTSRLLLRQAIKQLTPREQYIYIYAQGLFGEEQLPLAIIARHFQITEGWILKLLKQAHEKVTRLLHGEELEEGGNRFKKQGKSESKESFLERLHTELSEYEDLELLEVEIRMILEALSGWQLKKIKKGNKEYAALFCKGREEDKDIEVSQFATNRRQITWVDSMLVIIVSEIKGSDIRQCIDLDRELLKKPFREEPHPFLCQFSPAQQEVIQLLFLSNAEIATKRNTSESVIREHIRTAAETIGLSGLYSGVNLATRLLEEGVLDLKSIPTDTLNLLTEEQKKFIHDYYALSHIEAARQEEVTVPTIASRWKIIYKKLKTSDIRQVVLMAMMEGIINVSSEERRQEIEAVRSERRSAELKQQFGSLFSPYQLDIITNLYTSSHILAYQRQVSNNYINRVISQAARRLGLTGLFASLDFTVIAAKAGLICLDDIPPGKTEKLTSLERKRLVKYYNKTYQEAAKCEEVSEGAIKQTWEAIHAKFDTTERRQAVLVAIKDGIIEAGEESSKRLQEIIETAKSKEIDAFSCLSTEDINILQLMYLTNIEIAEIVGDKVGSVTDRLREIAHSIGTKGTWAAIEVAVSAIRSNILSLENVPAQRTKLLNSRQKEVLRDCYLMLSRDAAEVKSTTRSSIDNIWNKIIVKLGASDRRQAVLMAIKDGLIVL